MSTRTLYHVTTHENATEIMNEGFRGGWGDVGYGVYLFDDFSEANSYAHDGGWDGLLNDPVIIEISGAYDETEMIIPDPGWPNPEDYECVRFRPMDDGEFWKPNMRLLDAPDTEPSVT